MSMLKPSLLMCFALLTTHTYAANDIIISLKNVRASSTGASCNFLWEIKNNTSINFSDFAYEFVLRDGSGNILEKELFRTRLTPNSSAVAERLFKCDARQIQYTGFSSTTRVNGEYLDSLKNKNQIYSIPVKIGSESALKVVK
jgi:hypothetical protein